MNKSDIIILEKMNELIRETIILTNEVKRIRTRMDSKCYQIGYKYKVIDNTILQSRKGVFKSYIDPEYELKNINVNKNTGNAVVVFE